MTMMMMRYFNISWLFFHCCFGTAPLFVSAVEEQVNRHHLRSSDSDNNGQQQEQQRELHKVTLPGGGTTLRAHMTVDPSDGPIFYGVPILGSPLEDDDDLVVCDALPWQSLCLVYKKQGSLLSNQAPPAVKQVSYGGSMVTVQPYRGRFTTDSRSQFPIFNFPFYGVPLGALESSNTLVVCDHQSLSDNSLGNCQSYIKKNPN